MKRLHSLKEFFKRMRYPLSMPKDIARDLDMEFSDKISFPQILENLLNPQFTLKFKRFMPRDHAEQLFKRALRKEIFKQNSLFSYHLHGGWMEFELQFDVQSRLRRVYIFHKNLKQKYELPLF